MFAHLHVCIPGINESQLSSSKSYIGLKIEITSCLVEKSVSSLIEKTTLDLL